MVFRNVHYCIIEEIFPCVAYGDSFQCVFNYCTLFLCLFATERDAESRFDLGDFRLRSHFTTQIIVKGTLIGSLVPCLSDSVFRVRHKLAMGLHTVLFKNGRLRNNPSIRYMLLLISLLVKQAKS